MLKKNHSEQNCIKQDLPVLQAFMHEMEYHQKTSSPLHVTVSHEHEWQHILYMPWQSNQE
jgi:hypothetical protein